MFAVFVIVSIVDISRARISLDHVFVAYLLFTFENDFLALSSGLFSFPFPLPRK